MTYNVAAVWKQKSFFCVFFFQAEDGIRDYKVTGVQTCALPIYTGDWAGEIANWQLPKSAGPGASLDFAFARALGETARGRTAEARQALSELEALGRKIAESETKLANPDPSYRLRPGVLLREARALLAEHEGDLPGAEKLLRQAVTVEETLPIDFGPPTIDKPTHELLGEFLLRRGRKVEAC